jgi:hypothetical protein
MYLKAIIGPATELHLTALIIKGEPRNVYLACALEDARWNVQAATVISDPNVCRIRPVETFIGTCGKKVVTVLMVFCVTTWDIFDNI